MDDKTLQEAQKLSERIRDKEKNIELLEEALQRSVHALRVPLQVANLDGNWRSAFVDLPTGQSMLMLAVASEKINLKKLEDEFRNLKPQEGGL